MADVLQPGDWAPHFNGTTNTAPNFAFGSLGGRYVILSLFGTLKNKAAAASYAHVLEKHGAWLDGGRVGAYMVVLCDSAELKALAETPPVPGVRMIFDPELAISRLYGRLSAGKASRQYAPVTYVLDPMLRVMAVIGLDENGAHDRNLDEMLSRLPPVERYAGTPLSAPVLLLPRVFEPEFCRMLVERYDAHGGQPSGFMRDVDGATAVRHDATFKRRSDWVIGDAEIHTQIRQKIERHLVPGVRAAFQFTATRVERYLVACYDSASGGFFKPHRDNTTKGTVHRRFAVTINLNAEDYEGGDLRFPEFGGRRYRAPTGGAAVFSCSVLHEAMPVTHGRRYAFLPFLYDEADEAVRIKNLRYLEGAQPAGTDAGKTP